MKKLSSFKDSKVDLKNVKGGGGPSPSSYVIIMHGPPGTEPNWIENAHYDYPSSIETCGCK